MIFTIGTSNRSLDEFIRELRTHNITQIVDVRSSPYSRLGHFNGPQIARWAPAMNLLYRQAGAVLGGRSEIAPDAPTYMAELDRLIGSSCRERIAIFCAEGNPEECHRSYEVGAALLVHFGIVATNIRRDGSVEDVTRSLRKTAFSKIPPSLRQKAGEIVMGDHSQSPQV